MRERCHNFSTANEMAWRGKKDEIKRHRGNFRRSKPEGCSPPERKGHGNQIIPSGGGGA